LWQIYRILTLSFALIIPAIILQQKAKNGTHQIKITRSGLYDIILRAVLIHVTGFTESIK